jgi:hypothetical protein
MSLSDCFSTALPITLVRSCSLVIGVFSGSISLFAWSLRGSCTAGLAMGFNSAVCSVTFTNSGRRCPFADPCQLSFAEGLLRIVETKTQRAAMVFSKQARHRCIMKMTSCCRVRFGSWSNGFHNPFRHRSCAIYRDTCGMLPVPSPCQGLFEKTMNDS